MSERLIHERLYQSKTLSDIDFGEYVKQLSGQIFEAYCLDPLRIGLELSVEPIHLPVDQAIPCGLIVNELLANSLKHAFPGSRPGMVRISFRLIGESCIELAVSDDGAGMPPNFRIDDTRSLGLLVVRTLVSQLGADLVIGSGNGKEWGTSFTLTWVLAAERGVAAEKALSHW